MEELERRYQQQQGRLRVEEDQALQQAIDKFKKAWYVPSGHLLHTIQSVFHIFDVDVYCAGNSYFFLPSHFPSSTGFVREGQLPSLCIAITALFFYPLLFLIDILVTLCNVMVWFLVVLPCLLQLEIILFFGGLCYFACGRRRKITGVTVCPELEIEANCCTTVGN